MGSRMNGIAFRLFRNRNSSQKNTSTVHSWIGINGIVPKERAHSVWCNISGGACRRNLRLITLESERVNGSSASGNVTESRVVLVLPLVSRNLWLRRKLQRGKRCGFFLSIIVFTTFLRWKLQKKINNGRSKRGGRGGGNRGSCPPLPPQSKKPPLKNNRNQNEYLKIEMASGNGFRASKFQSFWGDHGPRPPERLASSAHVWLASPHTNF